jgi:hypothetical protein
MEVGSCSGMSPNKSVLYHAMASIFAAISTETEGAKRGASDPVLAAMVRFPIKLSRAPQAG